MWFGYPIDTRDRDISQSVIGITQVDLDESS